MTMWLATQGFETFGIDISPTAIEWAKRNAEVAGLRCEFTNGDILDYSNYPSDAVDMVLDGNVLHCIIGDDRAKLFQNVRRVLRTGGYFLVRSVLSPVDDKLPSQYRFDPTSLLLFHEDVAYRYIPTFEMLKSEVSDAGFNILGSELAYDLAVGRGFQYGMIEAST